MSLADSPSNLSWWRARLAPRTSVLRSWSAIPPRVLGHIVVVAMCLCVAYVGHRSPIGGAMENRPDQPGLAPVSALVSPGSADSDLLGSVAAPVDLSPPNEKPLSEVDSHSVTTGRGEEVAIRPDLSERMWTRPLIVDAADVSPSISSVAAPVQAIAPLPTATPSPAPRLPTATPVAQTDTTKTLSPVVYYVVDGDTLSSIAQQFGVSVESIAAASGLQGSEDSLTVHQKLIIPPVPGVVHVVQSGESLEAIARRYSADFDQIALANGLKDPFTIQVGQTLIIPDGKVPSAMPVAPPPTTAPAPSPSPTPAPPAAHTTYTVSQGDSLSSIANAFGVDLQSIVSANSLSVPYVLHPGQEIVVPGVTHPVSQPKVAVARTPTTVRAAATYTVQTGDSLSRIAVTFGVSPSVIVGANDLANPNSLRAGERLVIPGVTHSVTGRDSSPTAVPATPTPVPATATPVPSAPVAAVSVPRLPAPPSPSPHRSADSGWQIVAAASKFLGAPYVWGGTTPKGFDCSGLVWYIYRLAGMPIPRNMWGQLQSGAHVARSDLQPGDIVFFVDTYQSGLSHDGIYIGGGRFINAENPTVGVAVGSLSNPYWSSRYYGATRPW